MARFCCTLQKERQPPREFGTRSRWSALDR